MLIAALLATAGPALAETAPDFTLRTVTDNTEVTLSQLRGKVVVMSFWATWCAPCLAEMPHLVQLYQDLGDADADGTDELVVLSVSIDDARDRSKIKPVVKSKQVTHPVLWDQGGKVSKVYNPAGTAPFTVIIDGEGNIVETIQGYAAGEECELRSKVAAVMGVEDAKKPEQCQGE